MTSLSMRQAHTFFTDPPYGLEDQDSSPAKELDFNGIYALELDGSLTVIDDSLTRLNGIVLSLDGNNLLRFKF